MSSTFLYHASAATAVTVPTGYVVTGIAAHATGSGAYFTIAPNGASAGDEIPVPAGSGIAIGCPVLLGNAGELGAGTVITPSGTDSFLVTMSSFVAPAVY